MLFYKNGCKIELKKFKIKELTDMTYIDDFDTQIQVEETDAYLYGMFAEELEKLAAETDNTDTVTQ